MSCSNSRWDSRFHFFVLRIYVCLYWLREIVFFFSPVRRGYIRKVSVHLVQKYFLHDCSTDSTSCSKRKKGIWWKKNQNKTSTRQIRDSVTVRNLKARKINTLFSLPIQKSWRRYAATSVVVFDFLDALSILRQRIYCCYCIIRSHLPPLTPLFLS